MGKRALQDLLLQLIGILNLLDGTRKADLIPVTIWGRKAEVICKYMTKGSYISLSGRLRTGSYEDKDGNKKYIAEVVAEDFKFVGNRRIEKDNSEASGAEQ